MSASAPALELAPDVRAAAGGDERAFERLVDATRTTVSSIAFAILRDAEMARDVAQEVYVAAWRELPKLREATSFLPWIRQTTRNRAHPALRSHVRRRRRVEPVELDRLLSAASDPRPDAMERLLAEEERALVAEAVDELPAASREVVVLYYREGESVRQVAGLLELSESAVKQRLRRARGALHDRLVEHVKATAPSAAFTAGVMSALSLAAPGAAAAATVGAAKAGGSAASGGAGFLGAGVGALGGALAGLGGGMLGIGYSARSLLQRARDARERRGVMAFAAANLVLTALFLAVVLAVPRPLPVTLAFAAMFAGFAVTHLVLLPRITARRKALERAEDPVAFAERERVERRHRILGFGLGLLFGGAAIVAAWWMGGM